MSEENNLPPYATLPIAIIPAIRENPNNARTLLHLAALNAGEKLCENGDDPYLVGCETLGIEPEERDRKQALDLLSKYDTGNNARFRIKVTDLEDVADGILDAEDFAAIAAIRSILGRERCRRITREQIAARMIGEASVRNVPPSELTPAKLKRVERCVARLHRNRRFSRFTYRRRMTFYSTKITNDADLAEEVIGKIIKRRDRKTAEIEKANVATRKDDASRNRRVVAEAMGTVKQSQADKDTEVLEGLIEKYGRKEGTEMFNRLKQQSNR